MQVAGLEVRAGMHESRERRTAVVLLYKHRLFRDIIVGVTAKHPDISGIQTTRSGENALRLIQDLDADKLVLIVERETHVNLDRGALAFLLRTVEGDPRIRVLAITLAGSGISIGSWRWLRRVDSDGLMQEILSE
jgi:hypothetical protein